MDTGKLKQGFMLRGVVVVLVFIPNLYTSVNWICWGDASHRTLGILYSVLCLVLFTAAMELSGAIHRQNKTVLSTEPE